MGRRGEAQTPPCLRGSGSMGKKEGQKDKRDILLHKGKAQTLETPEILLLLELLYGLSHST